jgi:hypothetical protein
LQIIPLVPLASSIFRDILKLLEPNLVYKGEEAKNFVKRKNNGIKLLQEYLQDSALISEDISKIQVSYLKSPYK